MRPARPNPLEAMTPVARLTEALLLALAAPTDALADEVGEIADWLAHDLGTDEVKLAKSIALAQWKAGLQAGAAP